MVMKTMNFDPFRFSHGILTIQLLFLGQFFFFFRIVPFLRLNAKYSEENRFMDVIDGKFSKSTKSNSILGSSIYFRICFRNPNI